MRTKLLFSTLLMFFLVNTSFGQNYVFRVLASKGANQVKKVSGETKPLKTGSTLMSGDQLIASSGAYIGLMHNSGRTIEVRNPGVTKITDLESKLASSKSTVANKYAQFVMNKMNSEDGDVNKNYRRNMKATGAVSRATSSGVKVMLPANPGNVKILNSEAIVDWAADESTENPVYMVSISNLFDEEIYTAETEKTSLSINFDDENLAGEQFYLLRVSVKDSESVAQDGYGIQKLTDQEAAPILENLESLKAEISDDTPLNNLIYASFYEENGLLLDAMTQYQKAIKGSPGIEDFNVLYDDFLLNQGLK